MKKVITIILLLTSFLVCCDQFVESKEKNKQLPKFEEVNNELGVYIIRYSNVIEKEKGKPIKIPIFGGIYEDITYEDLEKQQTHKDIYLLGNIYVEAKDGEVKKTFFDILNFYKKSFFKGIDVNKPSVIGNEGGESLFIWYDFDYEGMPCSMMITVAYDKDATSEKIKRINSQLKKGERREETIDMYEYKEDSKWIGIRMSLGRESGYKKK